MLGRQVQAVKLIVESMRLYIVTVLDVMRFLSRVLATQRPVIETVMDTADCSSSWDSVATDN